MSRYPATCLYCGIRTGTSWEPLRRTVCNRCKYRRDRDEAREVTAGMRPWARPLSSWPGKPLPDAEAAAAQAQWDAEQNRP